MSENREYIKKLEEQLEGIRELIIQKHDELDDLYVAKLVLTEKISEANGVASVDEADVQSILNK